MPTTPNARFVILDHDHPTPHLDFMLEREGRLRTWRLPANTIEAFEGGKAFAVSGTALPDHRLAYLTYEGEVRGGRGSVRQVTSGTYTERHPMDWSTEIVIAIESPQFQGIARFTSQPNENGAWQFYFEPG